MPFAPELVGASRDTCRAYFQHFLMHWSYRKDAFDRRARALGRQLPAAGQPARRLQLVHLAECRPAGGDGRHRAEAAEDQAAGARLLGPPRSGAAQRLDRCSWPEYFENVEASIAEDAGHFVHYETPDAAAAEIDRFFQPHRLQMKRPLACARDLVNLATACNQCRAACASAFLAEFGRRLDDHVLHRLLQLVEGAHLDLAHALAADAVLAPTGPRASWARRPGGARR